MIKELRAEFGPRIPLRIDPNCAWSVDTSVHVGGRWWKNFQVEDIWRSLSNARGHGGGSAAFTCDEDSNATSEQCGRNLICGRAESCADWMPCRLCFRIRITGVACGKCSICRISAKC